MAIAASGAVSFSDLRTEFVGGSAAISYSDLYRGGSNIRAKAANNTGVNLAASVPTSGTINIANFRSQAKGFRFTFTSGATNQSAATLFGDDYAVDYRKEIVIDSGVELGATSTSEEALEIPSGGSGTIVVTNNGTLSGAGGAAGAAGGDAFEAAVACTLINNGTIRAGGGGGGTGGGGSYQTSSTSGPYYSWPYGTRYVFLRKYGANRGMFWANSYVGQTANLGTTVYSYGSQISYDDTYESYTHQISRTIYSTTNTNGGSGGVGQGYNQSAGSGVGGGTNAGTGGSGASFGSAGSIGVNGNRTNGVAGGAAGNYIRGVSFVTLTQSGTVQGGTA
tara:strand:+ start:228 stop:1235 length:1008 start_codon:yes stop_codon:yes gene_type:complete